MYFGNLPEEFMVVIMDTENDEFSIKNNIFIELALSGSILLELLLRGRLSLKGDELVVIDETYLDEDLLNTTFNIIKQEEDTFTVLYWLREINDGIPNIKNKTLEQMIDKNIIEKYTKKVLFIIPITKYKLVNPEIQEVIRHNIHETITQTKEVDPRTLAFLSVLYATNSAQQIFTSEELENYMNIIRGLVGDETIGQSIRESIQIITDALMRNYIVNFYTY